MFVCLSDSIYIQLRAALSFRFDMPTTRTRRKVASPLVAVAATTPQDSQLASLTGTGDDQVGVDVPDPPATGTGEDHTGEDQTGAALSGADRVYDVANHLLPGCCARTALSAGAAARSRCGSSHATESVSVSSGEDCRCAEVYVPSWVTPGTAAALSPEKAAADASAVPSAPPPSPELPNERLGLQPLVTLDRFQCQLLMRQSLMAPMVDGVRVPGSINAIIDEVLFEETPIAVVMRLKGTVTTRFGTPYHLDIRAGPESVQLSHRPASGSGMHHQSAAGAVASGSGAAGADLDRTRSRTPPRRKLARALDSVKTVQSSGSPEPATDFDQFT